MTNEIKTHAAQLKVVKAALADYDKAFRGRMGNQPERPLETVAADLLQAVKTLVGAK